ncbi:hypothetical protein [Rhodococcus erythropolis]|uniref:hypothetical protein n=1 Tax=Rhodococcus erythropolis TaxID=1833 RepID=UPI0021BEC0FC|nr:hypothetical protein [Rhodococcus erythropolis]
MPLPLRSPEWSRKSSYKSPQIERREALANLSLEHPRIKVPPHWLNVDGPTMLDVAKKHHLEGIVAKNISSIYQLSMATKFSP